MEHSGSYVCESIIQNFILQFVLIEKDFYGIFSIFSGVVVYWSRVLQNIKNIKTKKAN